MARRPPRRAPEVDMEWPADGPAPSPRPDLLPVLVMTLSVASLAVILAASDGLRRWAIALLAGLCAVALLDEAARWRASRPTAERALERAAWGLYLDEEPLAVLGGLRGVEMPGRAGLCLRVAVRCPERAGRCRRVDRRMRWEAARWMRRVRGEMGRWA